MYLEINNNDLDHEVLDTASQIHDRTSEIFDMVSMDPNNPVKSSTEMDDLIRATLTGPVKSSTEMDDLIRTSLSTVTRLHRLTSLGNNNNTNASCQLHNPNPTLSYT